MVTQIEQVEACLETRGLVEPDQVDGAREVARGCLVLSSSLLTDRMLLHSGFIDALSESGPVDVWATSASNPKFYEAWKHSRAQISEFPDVLAFREFPHNYLRRLNEYAWDFRQRPPSRLSMMRHIRDRNAHPYVRALKTPARILAALRVERAFEGWLERRLRAYERSPEATRRFKLNAPDVLLCTNPFWFTEPAVVAAAKREGISTLALIPSWDNLSTKNRMLFKHDGYLVWSEAARRELHQFYPATRNAPVHVVGAPQFDLFFQERFHRSREAFCQSQGLRPDLPIVVYALGSPNFLVETPGALHVADLVARGELKDIQLLVRPHPIHDNHELHELFGKFGSRVVVQQTGVAGASVTERFQDQNQIVEWVNTFRHADVVVNLSSTVTIDAAIFDRPVINLDFDPAPGQPHQSLIKEINHLWTHFKPVAESGGVWLVNDFAELVNAIKTYLVKPELHREKRRSIAEYVCGYLDGSCGERAARAVMAFVEEKRKAQGSA
ncbi:MAG: hypothetical protein ND895_27110 [Pyrinomonadaceae bacterium]|nr:hypothetical protein [Pyrinomonadaceae bacterium]